MRDDDLTLFFCIGAQKAGTTWLYDTLAAHPECHLPTMKEVHYFDALETSGEDLFIGREVARVARLAGGLPAQRGRKLARMTERLRRHLDYLDIFGGADGDHSRYLAWITRGRGASRVVADITPAYALVTRNSYAAMAGAAPDTRFLFILRDPAERVWSALRNSAIRGNPTDERFRRRCLERLEAFLADSQWRRHRVSDYGATIRELEAAVPVDCILYLFYEELFTAPAMERLAAFLGIGPIAADFAARSNPGRSLPLEPEAAARLREKLAPIYAAVEERFGDRLPARWRG
ncbi:MAG TPA: sulfotransferase [Paracoccaceae bacterium]|nr:sulfotransferase [Paracoccaceae bacterium]